MNKIVKTLARSTKEKREKTQIRNEKGELSTHFIEIKRIIREYQEEMCTNN